MFNHKMVPPPSRWPAAATLLVAMAIGVGACGAGATTPANTTAAAINPASQPVATTAPATVALPDPTPTTQASPAAPTPAAPHKTTTAPPSTKVPATAATTPPSVTAPTTPALPPRTQPTAAQVNQVIASVHALFPLFTPTPAQIAQVGNEVCTAFDQGKTVAQVKTAAMQVAGVYAALIPPNVVNTAVRTIVTLYCPGYTSKLA